MGSEESNEICPICFDRLYINHVAIFSVGDNACIHKLCMPCAINHSFHCRHQQGFDHPDPFIFCPVCRKEYPRCESFWDWGSMEFARSTLGETEREHNQTGSVRPVNDNASSHVIDMIKSKKTIYLSVNTQPNWKKIINRTKVQHLITTSYRINYIPIFIKD